jgi:hypothetical protein
VLGSSRPSIGSLDKKTLALSCFDWTVLALAAMPMGDFSCHRHSEPLPDQICAGRSEKARSYKARPPFTKVSFRCFGYLLLSLYYVCQLICSTRLEGLGPNAKPINPAQES